VHPTAARSRIIASSSCGSWQRFPSVPSSRAAQLRNRIVHGYWSVDLTALHTTAVDQLPAFTREVREVLSILESDGHHDR